MATENQKGSSLDLHSLEESGFILTADSPGSRVKTAEQKEKNQFEWRENTLRTSKENL